MYKFRFYVVLFFVAFGCSSLFYKLLQEKSFDCYVIPTSVQEIKSDIDGVVTHLHHYGESLVETFNGDLLTTIQPVAAALSGEDDAALFTDSISYNANQSGILVYDTTKIFPGKIVKANESLFTIENYTPTTLALRFDASIYSLDEVNLFLGADFHFSSLDQKDSFLIRAASVEEKEGDYLVKLIPLSDEDSKEDLAAYEKFLKKNWPYPNHLGIFGRVSLKKEPFFSKVNFDRLIFDSE